MTRKYVRHAMATYMTSPKIPGVGTVFASPPKISTSGDAYEGLPPGTPSGSVIYVEVLKADEKRIALGGPTQGTKALRFQIRLHLLFRSTQQAAQDAMDDHDDQVEAILARLRTDRTLGTNGAILQYGQDDNGISVATGMPKTSGTGKTHIWTIIDGSALQMITA